MNIKSITTYSLGILLSLSLAGGLFFLGYQLIPDVPEMDSEQNEIPTGSTNTISREDEHVDKVSSTDKNKVAPSDYSVNLSVGGVRFNSVHRNYDVTLNATYDGVDNPTFEYLVYDGNKNLVFTRNTPRFSLDATSSGVYYLSARETNTNKESELQMVSGCVVRKMSKKRLEEICNSGNYSNITNAEAYDFAQSLTLKFEPSSEIAYSISEVCNTIALGIWKEVNVSDIKYDNLGRIKEVKFNVVK